MVCRLDVYSLGEFVTVVDCKPLRFLENIRSLNVYTASWKFFSVKALLPSALSASAITEIWYFV